MDNSSFTDGNQFILPPMGGWQPKKKYNLNVACTELELNSGNNGRGRRGGKRKGTNQEGTLPEYCLNWIILSDGGSLMIPYCDWVSGVGVEKEETKRRHIPWMLLALNLWLTFYYMTWLLRVPCVTGLAGRGGGQRRCVTWILPALNSWLTSYCMTRSLMIPCGDCASCSSSDGSYWMWALVGAVLSMFSDARLVDMIPFPLLVSSHALTVLKPSGSMMYALT